MQNLLVTLLSFADFWFYPLIALFLVAAVAEQIVRRVTTSEAAIYQTMRLRRFLWQQNLLINFIWLICWLVLSFTARPQVSHSDAFNDPGLLWRT